MQQSNIFKKLDGDQNNEELNSPELCENVEEKIAVEENTNEETPNEELTTQEPYQTQKESILSI